MKKLTACFLSTALLLSLCACSENASSTSASSSQSEVSSEENISPNASADSEEAKTAFVSKLFSLQTSIDPVTLVDEKGIVITADELSYTSYSAELALTIENNSSEDLSFRCGTLGYSCNSVNGYMMADGYLNVDVSAGKKSAETISFGATELMILGLTDIADIEIGFDISDGNRNTYLQTGPLHINTSLADTYDYSADPYQEGIANNIIPSIFDFSVLYHSTEELYNQNDIRILSETLVKTAEDEFALLLEVENNSDNPVYTSISNIGINGLEICSPTWTSDSLNSRCRRVIMLSLNSMMEAAFWDALGITDIETVQFSFSVADQSDNSLIAESVCQLKISENAAGFDRSGDTLYNDNGIQIISKCLVEDSSDYSGNVHLLLLLENSTTGTMNVDVAYNSVSVNGYMTDFLCYSSDVSSGSWAILDMELRESSLEEASVTSISDIKEIEMTFEVVDDSYNSIDTPTATALF